MCYNFAKVICVDDSECCIGSRRGLGNLNNWEMLDFEKFGITKPTILCFGGNSTTDVITANVFCKITSNLIRLKSKTRDDAWQIIY